MMRPVQSTTGVIHGWPVKIVWIEEHPVPELRLPEGCPRAQPSRPASHQEHAVGTRRSHLQDHQTAASHRQVEKSDIYKPQGWQGVPCGFALSLGPLSSGRFCMLGKQRCLMHFCSQLCRMQCAEKMHVMGTTAPQSPLDRHLLQNTDYSVKGCPHSWERWK